MGFQVVVMFNVSSWMTLRSLEFEFSLIIMLDLQTNCDSIVNAVTNYGVDNWGFDFRWNVYACLHNAFEGGPVGYPNGPLT